MAFRFTIGKKIGTGFGVLIVFIIVVFGATFFAVRDGIETFKKNDQTSTELIQIITPSKEKITKLRLLVNESKQLSIQWVNTQTRNDVPDKVKLKRYIEQNIPDVIESVDELTLMWTLPEDSTKLNPVETFNEVKEKITELFSYYEQIMMFLPDIASYDDALMFMMANTMTTQDGDIPVLVGKIDHNLLTLQNYFEDKEEKALVLVKESSDQSKDKFESLKIYWYLSAALILAAIVIAVFTTNSIVKPVRGLRRILISLGRGETPREKMKVTNDEIGDMSFALNNLVDGLKSTTDFARNVGQSKFDTPYKALSENDELGHALLKMRDELAETERILEMKVKERTEEVVKQREKLEELYNDVTDSILYAKRLQDSILPSKDKIQEICPSTFVHFKPKDIVSGDFYWFDQINGKSLYAAVDCTGHGVPGAFMSLVGANGLNSAVHQHKIDKPSEILNELNTYVSDALNKGDQDSKIRDGMDMTLCSIDYKSLTLEYAGANNPLYIIRNGEFLITKADKFAIASFLPNEKQYTNHKIQLEKGDSVYVFSDGYADQFGGDRGKKFMYKNFRTLLLEIHNLSVEEQQLRLDQEMAKWQKDFEQVDDILIIGMKI